jgi:hypothetical protein
VFGPFATAIRTSTAGDTAATDVASFGQESIAR